MIPQAMIPRAMEAAIHIIFLVKYLGFASIFFKKNRNSITRVIFQPTKNTSFI